MGKPHPAKNQGSMKARAGSPRMAEQPFERPFVSQVNRPRESGTASAEPADALPGSSNDSPGMLRIEIQTGDPNIRIIWFAPKEVESPNESPKSNQ